MTVMATRGLMFFFIVALCSCHAFGASSYISTGGIEGRAMRNRHLLQAPTPCSVNFQVQNYTIIVSECKGPSYPQNACCTALLKFACPFAAEINDNTTDCATTMFNYINIYGNYPAGLFANECTGNDSRGLPCPASSTTNTSSGSSSPNTSSSQIAWHDSGHQVLCWIISIIISTIVLFDFYVGEVCASPHAPSSFFNDR